MPFLAHAVLMAVGTKASRNLCDPLRNPARCLCTQIAGRCGRDNWIVYPIEGLGCKAQTMAELLEESK